MQMKFRSTSPSYFTHRELYDLDMSTGLRVSHSYHGLWGACDRRGLFEWKPGPLKLAIDPYPPYPFNDVLAVLARELYVVQYVVQGRAYGWLPTFPKHQRLNAQEKADAKIPPPPRAVMAWYQRAALAKDMGVEFTEPNPLSDPLPVSMAAPGPMAGQNGATDVPPQSTNGAGSLNGKHSNGLHEPLPDPNALVSRNGTPGNAIVTRDSAPSFPFHSSPALGQEQQELEYLDGGETGARDPEGAEPGAGSGMAVDLYGGARQVALPRIRGERNVAAIQRRLALTLAECAAGQRPALGREQWRTVAAEMVFAYWANKYDKPKSFLSENDKREARILARLKENHDDVNELLYALDGAKRSKWHMGDNDSRTVYDQLDTLLRDRGQVEKFAALTPGFRNDVLHPLLVKYAPVFLLGIGAPEKLRDAYERHARQQQSEQAPEQREPPTDQEPEQ